MEIENPIFDALEEKTSVLEPNMIRGLQLGQLDYAVNARFNGLLEMIFDLPMSGKIACAQWALAQITKDDPRGLIVYFCLHRIIRNNARKVDPYEYIVFARKAHPTADGKPDPRDTPDILKRREKARKERIQESIASARDLREALVNLIGKPLPTDLFTRITVFESLSGKEVLAVFIACVGHQETDWVAQAFSSAQNARAQLAMEDADKDRYARSLHLSEIYLKALQLHLQNEVRNVTKGTPSETPVLISSGGSKKKESKNSSPEPTRAKSANKLPFTS